MKTIGVTYFRPNQISLLSQLTFTTPMFFFNQIQRGYSIILDDGRLEERAVSIQIWNILKDDVDRYGDPIDRYILSNAFDDPNPNGMKMMVTEDRACIRCKFLNAIENAFKALDTDEAILSVPIAAGSMNEIVMETLQTTSKIEIINSETTHDGKHNIYIRLRSQPSFAQPWSVYGRKEIVSS